MTILEKIKFEEEWLSEVNLTKENIKIAFAGIRSTVLEQQPCEDCISREVVDDYIVKLMSGYLYDEERTRLEEFSAYLWELPSVTPKAEWIPVSERLPEEDGMYLVSIEGNITHKIIVDIAHWFECEKSNNGFYTANEVFAWMPLPEPYKAEIKTEQALAYADQDTLMPAT